MSAERMRTIERTLADGGFGGLHVRQSGGALVLTGALPCTDDALALLEAAFAMDDEPDASRTTEASLS